MEKVKETNKKAVNAILAKRMLTMVALSGSLLIPRG